MRCDEWLPLIEECLDGELDSTAVKRLREHLSECPECDRVYKRVEREQQIYRKYERDLDVPPGLWESVESRIIQESRQERRPATSPRALKDSWIPRMLQSTLLPPRLSPALAVLLVLVGAVVTVVVMRETRHNPNPLVAKAPPSPQPPAKEPGSKPAPGQSPEPGKLLAGTSGQQPPQAPGQRENLEPPRKRPAAARTPTDDVQRAVRDAEQRYTTAIALLEREVAKHKSQIDPSVLAKYKDALASIDRTIEDTRRAARQHPDDPVAAQYMLAAYSDKVEVLKEVAGM